MKYYIKLHWWRQCHARPGCSQNLTIEGDPAVYLERQRQRLGDEWTYIQIDFCSPVGDDAVVDADPDLGYKAPPPTPEQIRRNAIFACCLLGGMAVFFVTMIYLGC